MFGSGGSEVAARVADGLGWTLLDNALVERVAARLGRTPVEVQAIEERVPSLAERLADALALGSPEIVSPVPLGPAAANGGTAARGDGARDRRRDRARSGRARRSRRAVVPRTAHRCAPRLLLRLTPGADRPRRPARGDRRRRGREARRRNQQAPRAVRPALLAALLARAGELPPVRQHGVARHRRRGGPHRSGRERRLA